jgi:DNA-binding PadR family transcriptional regulator
MEPKTASRNSDLSVTDIKTRIFKEFLDLIILFELSNKELSGYDLIAIQSKRFGMDLSPGTVYATLYSMERKGFIKGNLGGNKTTYVLTSKGKEGLETFKKASGQLEAFMKAIFPVLFQP